MRGHGGTTRRQALQLGSRALIWAVINGKLLECTPREAAAAQAQFRFFSTREGELLAELAEILVPGAAAAGCAHLIDYHVSVPPADSLLSARYFDIAPPYGDFYRAGLQSLAQLLGKGSPPADLASLGGTLLHSSVPNSWRGPPPTLFYLVVRSDAIDSVYCTVEGFARLKVPYLPHIPPTSNW